MRSFFACLHFDTNAPDGRSIATILNAAIRTFGPGSIILKRSDFHLFEAREPAASHDGKPAVGANLGTNDCIIFGTLAPKPNGSNLHAHMRELPAAQIQNILTTRGQTLIEDYWGDYVAFIQSRSGWHVVCAPTSSLPCYYMTYGGWLLIFSDLGLCPFLRELPLSINRSFVAKLLAYDKIQTGETGLNEISELPSGSRLSISSGAMSTEIVWDPRKLSETPYSISTAEAAELLRDAIQAAVKCHADSYGRVTVNLSGGLDSSIVLVCLSDRVSKGDVNAIHYEMGSNDHSERRYAQLIADAVGCPLEIVRTDAKRKIPCASDHPLTVRPHRSFVGHDSAANEVGNSAGVARAIFTGQGGDHIFFESKTPLTFADFFRQRGFSRRAIYELFYAAHASGTSVSHVLSQCMPYLFGRKPESTMSISILRKETPLNREAFRDLRVETMLPAWVTDPTNLPPAKFVHVNNIYHMLQSRENTSTVKTAAFINPFISQPLVELCLALPTSTLRAYGESRGLARRAFEDQLPDAIRRRTTKGLAANFFVDHLESNKSEIRDALVDGELMKMGLLSAPGIESYFSEDNFKIVRLSHMTLVYYSIEAWLRSWSRFLSGRRPPG